jgi:hypothetical protein
MKTKIIDNNGIVSFDSISSEEDLKLPATVSETIDEDDLLAELDK